MDKMDFFSFDDGIDHYEISEVRERALKQFQVLKICIEDFEFLDNLTSDEKLFYLISKVWWFGNDDFKGLTDKQKKVVFFYIVQNFTIQEISIHLNTDKSSVYRILRRAFIKSKTITNYFYNKEK